MNVNNELQEAKVDAEWLELMYSFVICLEGLKKITIKFIQESRSRGRVLNGGPLEYETGVLSTLLWRSLQLSLDTKLLCKIDRVPVISV
jgi:hypothetical protein